MTRGRYQWLFSGTERFTTGTRSRFERAVGRALFGYRSDRGPLRAAVHRATSELRTQGLDATAVLTVLGAVVEEAGRSCGADRSSLLSGEPLWASVRDRVLEVARDELADVELLLPSR